MKDKWKKCKNIISATHHYCMVNEECQRGQENDEQDYFVRKNWCDSCNRINLEEVEE
jgi:hypothetical protein